jgi:hypothetical protein
VWLNCSSDLLAGELASLWRCLLLGGGLSSTSSRLLSSVMSVTLLKGEATFWPWRHRPRGNRHHGLCGRSVLYPWCGCGAGEQGPRAVLLGEGRSKLPSPLDSMRNPLEESSIMAHPRADAPLRVETMKLVPTPPLLGERLRPLKLLVMNSKFLR